MCVWVCVYNMYVHLLICEYEFTWFHHYEELFLLLDWLPTKFKELNLT